jgi:transcriptional regulator with XRE-family HTH domain
MRHAEKLYKQMLLKGFNQQKLARLSSVSDSEISRILKGKSNPSLEYAFRLAQALGISLDYLADDRLDEDRRGPAAELTPVEAEVLEVARDFDPRQARRILETAADLGYEVAIRRLLGAEMKPIIEVGDGRQGGGESGAASIEGRVNRASSA